MKRLITLLFVFCLGVWWAFLYIQTKQQQQQTYIKTVQQAIVTRLEQTQQLSTATMNIQQVLEWKKSQTDIIPAWWVDDVISDFLFKDELMLILDADITAWYDLKDITQSWIVITPDNQVTLFLPEAKILTVWLSKDTQALDRKLWLLTKWDIKLESELRAQALELVQQQALSWWILEQARQWASKAFQDLLSPLWLDVVIQTTTSEPTYTPQ